MPQTWTICINGFAWGNRHRSAEETIAEVQRILDDDRATVARLPKYHSSWLTKWVRFNDAGIEIPTPKPATVTIEEGSTVYKTGPVIARWIGGERVDVEARRSA
jgi:hypothetical protein